jgi:uncharacterized protein (TIGR02246 family)
MKTFLKNALFSFALLTTVAPGVVLPQGVTLAAEADDAAIIATLDAYEAALNKSDVPAIVALYTADGVQMAPDFPAAVGAAAVAASYGGTFQAVTLNLDFTVDEIKLIGADDAILRTHSNGTLKVNGSDQAAAPTAFKELFVLHKVEDGSWKFTHYSFSAVAVQ